MKSRPQPHAPTVQPRGRYFRLTYSNTAPDDEPKLFQGRDGIAFNELSAGLPALGYEYGTTIHFYPDDARKLSEFPAFTTDDLLVLTTRPPLTDRESLFPPRKIIRNSKNELEKLIFKQLFTYIAYCSRKHLKLSPDGKKALLRDPDKWSVLEFFENAGDKNPSGQAYIQKHGVAPPKGTKADSSTVAFLVRASALPGVEGTPGVPCGLLASFGMDGYTTLIWNRLVRLRYPQWLTTPGFVMAELIFRKPIPPLPLTPEFADDPNFVEVNVLTKS